MSNLSIPIASQCKAILHNGVGRYVCQLQRLTIHLCKERGDSRVMRKYIEQDLLDFTKKNPGVVVYVQPRRHSRPKLVAEYLNGNEETLYADKFEHEELVRWVEHLRTRSGKPITKMGKPWHTDNPSIQGTWTPFTNRPTAWNVTQFPSAEYSSIPEKEVSATDKLLAMAAQLRAKGVEEPQQ